MADLTVSHTLGLVIVSFVPFVMGLAGVVYAVGAIVLGVFFFLRAARFARHLDESAARSLFYGSIIYLPLLLGLMVFDKAI